MNFLMDGDALVIFCSASLVRDRVASEGGAPCSWAVQMSWPVLCWHLFVRRGVERRTEDAEQFRKRR